MCARSSLKAGCERSPAIRRKVFASKCKAFQAKGLASDWRMLGFQSDSHCRTFDELQVVADLADDPEGREHHAVRTSKARSWAAIWLVKFAALRFEK